MREETNKEEQVVQRAVVLFLLWLSRQMTFCISVVVFES